VACRSCCCGNPRKHPGTDHQWQLDRLRAAAENSGGRLEVRTTDCLGPCEYANVVVVQPSSQGRRQGGRAVWIGLALDDGSTDEILTWATAGGPGITAPPPALALQFIQPPSTAGARTRR
jgi:predicted metal-binding protein